MQAVWKMISVVWNGTTLTVLVDGVALTPLTTPVDIAGIGMTDTAREITVGGDGAAAASWDGWIFSPTTWTTALTAAELLTIFAGKAAFEPFYNSGNYVSSATMNHRWDWRNRVLSGWALDYPKLDAGATRSLDVGSVGITNADLSTDVPT